MEFNQKKVEVLNLLEVFESEKFFGNDFEFLRELEVPTTDDDDGDSDDGATQLQFLCPLR